MRGTAPMIPAMNMRVTVTHAPRWSVANATGSNRSTVPLRASGQAGCLAVAMSWSPTHSTIRPGCSPGACSGHTVPSGRRRPEASCPRLPITSATSTPCGSSTSARQPGPSRMIGAGNVIPLPLDLAEVIPPIPSDSSARITMSEVSLGAFAFTTARVISGSSTGAPATPSASTTADASTRSVAVLVITHSTTTAARPNTDARRLIRERRRTRLSRWRHSFRYSSASSRRAAAARSG